MTTTFTARTPEDLLAVVPCVLGFHPSESIVLLTFGGERSFHARMDLPEHPEQLPQVCEALLAPALHHRVRTVAFVAYAAEAERAAAVALVLSEVFLGEGFDVLPPLRSDGTCWFHVRPGELPEEAEPHPYDVATHPLAAEAVLSGRVTHASRDELAATLDPDLAGVAVVEELIAELRPGRPGRAAAERWVAALVTRGVAGERPTDAEVARLVTSCADVVVRDAGLFLVTREDAERHAEFWADVTRRTPEPWVAAPAAMVGFCAWLAGHGALAWCGVDRARESDPLYSLADCVAGLLERAVPPSAWSRIAGSGSREA